MILRGLAIWSSVGIGHLAVIGSIWSSSPSTGSAPLPLLLELHPASPAPAVPAPPAAAAIQPAPSLAGPVVSLPRPTSAPRAIAPRPEPSPRLPVADAGDASPPLPTPPRFLSRVEPAYPPRALRAGVGGVVTLHLQLSAEGRLLAASVAVTSGEPLLDEAALAAARASRYEPATLGGRPVESETTADYRFELR